MHRGFPVLSLLIGIVLVWGLGGAPSLAARQAGEPANGLAERARDRGDAAPAEWFFELATRRASDAPAVLERALGGLADVDRARRAYGAFGLFRGGALEGEAIARVGRIAFADRRAAHQRGAVHALTLLGPAAEAELWRVLQRHPDKTCRSFALRALLPQLYLAGDEAAARWVLAHADLELGIEPGVRAVLEVCRDRPSELAMARELRQVQRSAAWKTLLLEVLARREGAVPRAAVERRLSDGEREVRLAAMGELARRDPRAAIEALRRLAREGDELLVRDAILALATLRDADPDWIGELATFARSRSVESRRAVVEALGELRTREALWLLHRLFADESWQVVHDAVRVALSLRQRESIPRLVALLDHDHARVQESAHEALRLLTAVDQGPTRARWRAWFEGEGGAFEVPSLEVALAAERARLERGAEPGRTTTFYGLRIDSKRLAFVIDVSGSMNAAASAGGPTSSAPQGATRLDVAVNELSNALRALLDGVRFNVITFGSIAERFEPRLVGLDERSRQRTLRRLQGLRAGGGTNLHGALLLALSDPDVDTLFVLTDGQPTVGTLTAPEEIRAAIAALNRERLVRIHGVAVGVRSSLLEGLAQDSGGQYREIR